MYVLSSYSRESYTEKKKKKEKNRLRLPSCDILNIKLLKRFKNPTDNIN